MDRYAKIDKGGALGEGTYGVVYKARDLETGEVVAMKKIRIEHDAEGVPSTAIRECCLLQKLKHPDIVSLENIVLERGRLHLVFEYMDYDLRKYLDTQHLISGPDVKSMLYQMIRAIEFTHRNGVIHRDLKPQNILINMNNKVKLADYGLARTFEPNYRQFTHEVVTLWYRAPEILLGVKTYTAAVDMWSVGTIFSEIVTKRPLFNGDSEIDQLFKIFKILGTPTEECWPGVNDLRDFLPSFPRWPKRTIHIQSTRIGRDAIDLLNRMLEYDPAKRITAREALEHEYFDDFDPSVIPGPPP